MTVHAVNEAAVRADAEGMTPSAETLCGRWIRLTRSPALAYTRSGGHLRVTRDPNAVSCPKCWAVVTGAANTSR